MDDNRHRHARVDEPPADADAAAASTAVDDDHPLKPSSVEESKPSTTDVVEKKKSKKSKKNKMSSASVATLSPPQPPSSTSPTTSISKTSITKHLAKLRVGKESPSNDKSNNNNGIEQHQKSAPGSTTLVPENVALPQTFQVKYLGKREAKGLWGIKHTRRPVDDIVEKAKVDHTPTKSFPMLHLHVDVDGVRLEAVPTLNHNNNHNSNSNNNNNSSNDVLDGGLFPIDVISYGVQDVVYQRIFAMIVVRHINNNNSEDKQLQQPDQKNNQDVHPFDCFVFGCGSSANARRLTHALAKAFTEFSKSVKEKKQMSLLKQQQPQRFAIDLRSPQEIEEDLIRDSEA